MRNLIVFCLIFCFVSCQESNTKQQPANSSKTNISNAAKTNSAPINSVALQSIPKERMMDLYENCTYIDFIFHNAPFSMSQSEQASIRANLAYVSAQPHNFIPSNCKAVARQMFSIGKDIVLEADVYFTDECKFYVFVENDKPMYANKMSPQGEEFFRTMYQRAAGAAKQAYQ